MKENKYDDPVFFQQYCNMERSIKGLQGAGEWYLLKKMFPNFRGKRVLDLGCGFGWHCRYAAEQGATHVTGIDISKNMISRALQINKLPGIEYQLMPIEDIDYPESSYDIVISSLTFHYIQSFNDICKKISSCLTQGGHFIFSVEHPVFTAAGNQEWLYDEKGNKVCWPVDKYFTEGKREAVFLGEKVIKYHRTLTTYLNELLKNGLEIKEIIEPEPNQEMIEQIPEMKDELRRPMMLLVSCIKK